MRSTGSRQSSPPAWTSRVGSGNSRPARRHFAPACQRAGGTQGSRALLPPRPPSCTPAHPCATAASGERCGRRSTSSAACTSRRRSGMQPCRPRGSPRRWRTQMPAAPPMATLSWRTPSAPAAAAMTPRLGQLMLLQQVSPRNAVFGCDVAVCYGVGCTVVISVTSHGNWLCRAGWHVGCGPQQRLPARVGRADAALRAPQALHGLRGHEGDAAAARRRHRGALPGTQFRV
jgi:hypothetical protein